MELQFTCQVSLFAYFDSKVSYLFLHVFMVFLRVYCIDILYLHVKIKHLLEARKAVAIDPLRGKYSQTHGHTNC